MFRKRRIDNELKRDLRDLGVDERRVQDAVLWFAAKNCKKPKEDEKNETVSIPHADTSVYLYVSHLFFTSDKKLPIA